MFNIGDKIKCINDRGMKGHVTIGKIYTILSPEDYRKLHGLRFGVPQQTIVLADDYGILIAFFNNERFELVIEPEIDYIAITRGLIGG